MWSRSICKKSTVIDCKKWTICRFKPNNGLDDGVMKQDGAKAQFMEDEMKRKRVAGKNEWKTGKHMDGRINMDGRIRHIDAPRKQYM
ncbi:hypothetical protein Tco_0593650 [Tanacetum coccineum]